jgi:hypothetical protein
MKGQARQAIGIAQENPLGLAVGAAAAGFIVGMLLPSSKLEDQHLGPMADDMKERAQQVGQEALERGKQVASDAFQAAQETATESGREQAEQLKETARS